MTLSEYSQLKRCIVHAVGQSDRHSELITTLKEMFKDKINSVRRFEQIDTIGKLFNVLEVRDILSEDKVECLKDIAHELSNSIELVNKITEYEECHIPRKYENYYVPAGNKNENDQSFISVSTVPLTRSISERKKLRIFQTIIEEIGSFWRDLGRNLQIRECEIDDIDLNNNSLTVKASKIMYLYEHKKADPDRWFFVLCDALEKTRRKDLTKSIQEVMTMNIN